METYWIGDPMPGSQPILSMPEAGPGVVLGEWTDFRGIRGYLVDEYVPGVARVYFVNGDPRAVECAARAEVERLAREREALDSASLLVLLSD